MPSLAKIQKYRSRTARSMCRKKTEKKCARVKGCKMTRKTMKRKSYCRKSRRHLVGGAKVVGGGDKYTIKIAKYIHEDNKSGHVLNFIEKTNENAASVKKQVKKQLTKVFKADVTSLIIQFAKKLKYIKESPTNALNDNTSGYNDDFVAEYFDNPNSSVKNLDEVSLKTFNEFLNYLDIESTKTEDLDIESTNTEEGDGTQKLVLTDLGSYLYELIEANISPNMENKIQLTSYKFVPKVKDNGSNGNTKFYNIFTIEHTPKSEFPSNSISDPVNLLLCINYEVNAGKIININCETKLTNFETPSRIESIVNFASAPSRTLKKNRNTYPYKDGTYEKTIDLDKIDDDDT
jgi:hypothetical protein